MISPRAPRDGDRSRTAPLPGGCRAIGAQLAAARETRQLSVDAVASKLLLSKGQILGLEHADSSAFYNPEFFIRALRKYMAAMQLPPDLLVEGDEAEEDGLRLFLADTGAGRRPSSARRVAPALAAGAGLAIAGVVAGGLYLSRTERLGPADSGSDTVSLAVDSPLPAQPMQIPAAAPPPVKAEPASAVGTSGDPDATVRVSVGKATWVFIRYPDNRVVERRLEAGEELEVGPLPLYLAVGTAESVELQVENRPVALEPYIRNGQVRITQPELARLVP